MTATNHALTGAVIGLVVGQPLIAVPAALASHFVCDALPHFWFSLPDEVLLKRKFFPKYLTADAGLCVILVILLAIFQPQHWLLAAVCAFIATSPDLASINQYLKTRSGKSWRPGRYKRLADGIQWFQRPIGAVVEVTWFVAAVIILMSFFR